MLRQIALDKTKRGHDIVVVLDQFLASLTAIAEISENADQVDGKTTSISDQMGVVLETLTEEQKTAVRHAWRIVLGKMRPDTEEGQHGSEAPQDEYAEEMKEEEDEDEDEDEDESPLVRYSPERGIQILDRQVGEAFQFTLRRAGRLAAGGSRSKLLRRSLVSSAVSAFEQLIGSLIDHVVRTIPAIVDASEYSFTLKELESFDSISDAREYLRERKVHSLLGEGLDGWQKFFARRDVGVDISTVDDSFSVTREFIARRNLLTHRNGVIDEKYLKVIGDVFDATPKLGHRANAGPEYIKQGLQALAGVGCVLAYGLWTNLHKVEKELAQRHVVDLQEELIELEFWVPAVDIKEAIADSDFVSRELLIRSSIHRWTGLKFGPFTQDDLRQEVEQWDTSGLDTTFSHTKSLLLDETERARSELSRLYEEGKMSPTKAQTNALYKSYSLGDLSFDQATAEGQPDS